MNKYVICSCNTTKKNIKKIFAGSLPYTNFATAKSTRCRLIYRMSCSRW